MRSILSTCCGTKDAAVSANRRSLVAPLSKSRRGFCTSVSSRIQKLFGVSRIKIDPQGLNSETSVYRGTQGPQLTVEQQVVSNLTLTYSTNVSVSNQQIIQGEYNITRNVSIIALRDQNGVVSFDLKIRRRKK